VGPLVNEASLESVDLLDLVDLLARWELEESLVMLVCLVKLVQEEKLENKGLLDHRVNKERWDARESVGLVEFAVKEDRLASGDLLAKKAVSDLLE